MVGAMAVSVFGGEERRFRERERTIRKRYDECPDVMSVVKLKTVPRVQNELAFAYCEAAPSSQLDWMPYAAFEGTK